MIFINPAKTGTGWHKHRLCLMEQICLFWTSWFFLRD